MSSNSVTHLSVKGSASAVMNIRNAFKAEGDHNIFDFEHFLPSPKTLNLIVSPPVIVDTPEEAAKINIEERESHLKAGGAEDDIPRRALTHQENSDLIAEFGENNWYDWNVEHWGVKWNCIEAWLMLDTETHFAVKFANAWSTPKALLDHIASLDGVEDVQWITIHDKNSGRGDVWSDDEAFSVFNPAGEEIVMR